MSAARLLLILAAACLPPVAVYAPFGSAAWAAAPSPLACATARRQGRRLAGCPGTGAQPVKPTKPAPTPRATPRPSTNPTRYSLPPGAIAMRDALASIPESQWIDEGDGYRPRLDAIYALGSLSDLRTLAESGNARAQFLFGDVYWIPLQGVAQNRREAVAWYRRAANQGDPLAQVSLGFAYETGDGVSQSDEAAAPLYAAGARQGLSSGQYDLAAFYRDGRGGLPQDYSRAMELFRQSAEQGRASSFSAIAHLYENGFGVAQDFAAAASWARAGATRDSANAQMRLGILLYEGRTGVPQNQTEGLMWLRRAAAAGEQSARNYLSERSLSLQ